ncbi:MAG: hypothetical protein KJ709_09395 [Nanoarchaeota archaeon]|nr:hypothetical protein [Nanoarchaeota archaeon]
MIKEGKYTIERFAEEQGLARQSALNKLSRLKRQGYVSVDGGGRQKRIYTISKLPRRKTNGFYDTVNRYSPEKLQPKFDHYVHGRYTVEHAIIDGIKIGDVRTRDATKHLFRHVSSWKKLFDLAKKEGLLKEVLNLYSQAKRTVRVRWIPRRYLK